MIGIIGAMSVEVEALKAAMTDKSEEQISGIAFFLRKYRRVGIKDLLQERFPVFLQICGIIH